MFLVDKMSKSDRVAIITFDNNAYFKLNPRPVEQVIRQNELKTTLDRIFAKGLTAIYDAIHLGISQMRNRDQKAIFIVLTDGEDNSSSHSLSEVTNMLSDRPNISLNIINISQQANTQHQNLCTITGGLYHTITETDISRTLESVFTQQYLRS